MATYDRNQYARPAYGAAAQAEIDQGLRSYMLQVYNYMAVGLVVTGLAAIGAFNLAITSSSAGAVAQLPSGEYLTQFGYALYASPLKWVVFLAPLAIVFLFSFRIHKMNMGTAQEIGRTHV